MTVPTRYMLLFSLLCNMCACLYLANISLYNPPNFNCVHLSLFSSLQLIAIGLIVVRRWNFLQSQKRIGGDGTSKHSIIDVSQFINFYHEYVITFTSLWFIAFCFGSQLLQPANIVWVAYLATFWMLSTGTIIGTFQPLQWIWNSCTSPAKEHDESAESHYLQFACVIPRSNSTNEWNDCMIGAIYPLFGAWWGAAAVPLDWDVWWQKWPICSLWSSIITSGILFVLLSASSLIQRILGRHTHPRSPNTTAESI